eukprot:6182325-Pleurochrysis_carterae.AAC.6
MANANDLADWLGIPQDSLFNFKPSVRPVPLEVRRSTSAAADEIVPTHTHTHASTRTRLPALARAREYALLRASFFVVRLRHWPRPLSADPVSP